MRPIATYALIHGGGGSAWDWHLVVPELQARGHDVVAVDLPAGDDAAGLWDYAGTVVEAVGARRELIVVGHSLGGFTAPLVCDRLPVDLLVMLTAMIPSPGESIDRWWTDTGHRADEGDVFYHDVAPELEAEATRRERDHPSAAAMAEAWPLAAWPDVPTRFVLCRDDRFFPAAWMRRVVEDRLGIVPDEIDGGHYVPISNPTGVAGRLDAYARQLSPRSR